MLCGEGGGEGSNTIIIRQRRLRDQKMKLHPDDFRTLWSPNHKIYLLLFLKNESFLTYKKNQKGIQPDICRLRPIPSSPFSPPEATSSISCNGGSIFQLETWEVFVMPWYSQTLIYQKKRSARQQLKVWSNFQMLLLRLLLMCLVGYVVRTYYMYGVLLYHITQFLSESRSE